MLTLSNRFMFYRRLPFLRDDVSANITASSSSITASLPDYEAGDVMVVLFYQDVNDGTLNTPTGYTLIDYISPSDDFQTAAFYRVMNGTEGSTITLSYSGGSSSTRTIRPRIYSFGAVTGSVEGDLLETANSTTGEFPSVTPSWGAGRASACLAFVHMRDPADPIDNTLMTNDGFSLINGGANLEQYSKVIQASPVQPLGGPEIFDPSEPAVRVTGTILIEGLM